MKEFGGVKSKPCGIGQVGFPPTLLFVTDESGFPLKRRSARLRVRDLIAV
jgi:hypothetical protein